MKLHSTILFCMFYSMDAFAALKCQKQTYEMRCLAASVLARLKDPTREKTDKFPDLGCHISVSFLTKEKRNPRVERKVNATAYLEKGQKCPAVGTRIFGNIWIVCNEQGDGDWPNRFEMRTKSNCLSPE